MKKLAGMFAFVVLATAGTAFAKAFVAATPNVFLDVQVSSNALPGAQVRGTVTAAGATGTATGVTNALGRVRLPFAIYVTTAAPFIPATYRVSGTGTDGMNPLAGNSNGNFQIIIGTPSTTVPIFLPLQ